MGGNGAAAGFAGAARARSALRPDAGVRRGGLRQGEGDHDPADGDVHGLQGVGRGEGQGSGDVHAVRRARAAEVPAGILLGGADLLGVRRDGDADRRSVPDVHGARRGCRREHTILVKVPAGVEQDTRIRYSGEGEAGKFGGPAGDLYVVLNVKAHKFFERDGDDLHCVMPISFPQAALGTELEIQTLEGAATIKVPEGTQSGKEFKLRGKGVPHLNSHGKGDLIVEIRVQTPCEAEQDSRRSCCGS